MASYLKQIISLCEYKESARKYQMKFKVSPKVHYDKTTEKIILLNLEYD